MPIPPRKAYHHPLRHLRKQKGWSAKELAQKAGIAERTIWGIEAGNPRGKPRYETRRKLLVALGLEWGDHKRVFEQESGGTCPFCGRKM